VALADALDVEQFIPVGYSMGGPIAQLIWQRHPERVRGLVLCATSHTFRDSPQEHVMFASLPALEHVSRIVPDLLSAEIMSRVASRYHAESGHAGWVRRELRLRDQVAVLQAASALGRYSARRWIGNIDVPTAVLVHGRDQMVPPARQLALAAAIPHAATHVVDSDHFAPVRKGATFPRALLEAIDEVERQREAHIGLRAAS
jgi:pimeloyl-ACP methyl ester carboxylesterase